MDTRQAIATFSSSTPTAQADLLLGLAHALTVVARDTYAVGRDGLTNPSRLRSINEVQHRITGFLLALADGQSERYPDDVLLHIILEHPEDIELQRQLQETVARLMAVRPSQVTVAHASDPTTSTLANTE